MQKFENYRFREVLPPVLKMIIFLWDRALFCSPGFFCILEVGLKLKVIFLPQSPESWDSRNVASCLAAKYLLMFYSVQSKLLFHTSYAEGIKFIHSVLFNINKVQWYRKHYLLAYWLLWNSAFKAPAQWSLLSHFSLFGFKRFMCCSIREHYWNADCTNFKASFSCPFVKLHSTPQALFFNLFQFERECYFKFAAHTGLELSPCSHSLQGRWDCTLGSTRKYPAFVCFFGTRCQSPVQAAMGITLQPKLAFHLQQMVSVSQILEL